MKAEFDELAPEPVSLNIPVDGVMIVALYFETDRAPFVVKNPTGGTVQREVPWREATSIKSATRSQLIKLLTPIQKLPAVEVVACLFQLSSWRAQGGKEYLSFNAALALFLTQPTNQETVFPSHRCEVLFDIPNFKSFPIKGGIKFYGVGASNVNATESSMAIRGSGFFEARTKHSFETDGASAIVQNETLFTDGLEVKLTLYSAEAERSLTINIELKNQTALTKGLRQWNLGWHSFLESPRR